MPKGTKSKRNHSKTKQSAPAPPSVLSTRAATRSKAVPVEKNSGPAPSSQPSSIALPQNIYWSSNYNSQALWHTFCRCSSTWLFPISLLLSIVESSTQIVPNAQPDPNIPPPLSSLAVTMAMDLNSTGGYDFDASMASMSNLCSALPRFDQLLEKLKVMKGAFEGYKCWHCKANRRSAMITASEFDDGTLACGCDTLKAVAEQALK